ncbi:MAG TPA: thiamine phosphate synthase [Vicinamibacterales bacterium]|nr:thiamine phosphate synthase [Vicinamibacterales bacterium]
MGAASPAPAAGVPRPRVGIVSDRHRLCAAAGRPIEDAPLLLAAQIEAAGESGVEFFQVREADLEAGALLRLVRELVTVARGRVRVVVNDRADIAAAAGADLHLRVASLPLPRLRAWLSTDMWVSRAVHARGDLAAAEGVDALIVGTVRPTVSKPADTRWLGVEGLRRIAAVTPLPVFAIGGLTFADWPALAGAGAAGIAAIGWMLPRSGEDAGMAVARAMADLGALVTRGAVPPGIRSEGRAVGRAGEAQVTGGSGSD